MYKKERLEKKDIHSCLSPEDVLVLRKKAGEIGLKYQISGESVIAELNNLAQFSIPADVFSQDLSPFETIVKYLHENKGLSLTDTAEATARTKQNVYTTYAKANRKYSRKLPDGNSEIAIPAHILSKRIPILESIVHYMHNNLNLTFENISRLLKRKYGTIWTVNRRIEKRDIVQEKDTASKKKTVKVQNIVQEKTTGLKKKRKRAEKQEKTTQEKN